MQSMDDASAALWCSARSIEMRRTSGLGQMYLSFPTQNRCIAIQTPAAAMRLVALARLLLLASGEDQDDSNFDGCLLWLRDWEIGSPELESVGWRVLQCLRGTSGAIASLQAAPASLFSQDEIVDAHVALVQPLTFGWDAYFVSASGQSFGFVSHHDLTYFVARTEGMLQRLCVQLGIGKWQATKCHWPARGESQS